MSPQSLAKSGLVMLGQAFKTPRWALFIVGRAHVRDNHLALPAAYWHKSAGSIGLEHMLNKLMTHTYLLSDLRECEPFCSKPQHLMSRPLGCGFSPAQGFLAPQ
jgi:hypothetical protein